jgi:hypothetical protein
MADSAHTTPMPATQPAPISLTEKGEAYAARHIFTHHGMTPADPISSFAFADLPLPAFDPSQPQHWRDSAERLLEWMLDRQFELIAALDQMEPDPDLEPWLAGYGWGADDDREGDPLDHPWGEAVNEDGGDILDENHDDENMDGEYSLGWSIPNADTSQGIGYLVAGKGDLEADFSVVDQFGAVTALTSDDEPDHRHLNGDLSQYGKHLPGGYIPVGVK